MAIELTFKPRLAWKESRHGSMVAWVAQAGIFQLMVEKVRLTGTSDKYQYIVVETLTGKQPDNYRQDTVEDAIRVAEAYLLLLLANTAGALGFALKELSDA